MILAISPGSEGSGSDRFVASIPFSLSPGSTLQLTNAEAKSFGRSEYVKLEKLQLGYLASIGAYDTEEAAELGLKRLNSAGARVRSSV